MTQLDIRQIPAFADNYIYLVREPISGAVAVVDPGAVTPVVKEAERLDWKITHILNTHHHPDHIGGNMELKWLSHCQTVGPDAEATRIPYMDVRLKDGDQFQLGEATAHVISVPGHTSGHIAFWFKEAAALFCGDTLFSVGCGRLFEGTPAQMWQSLKQLRDLPAETRVYCAHEYTESNVRFAVSIDPNNAALRQREMTVRAARAANRPTVPSLLSEERAVNPFLRADNPEMQAAIGMSGQDPTAVFAEIRKRKDSF